ncbi:MAG: AAA family ATPase [Actinobacteria bacterium]|nr:AAA family ATPase [Actinomycetota bacterium]
MAGSSELEYEQAYLDWAHRCLDEARRRVLRLRSLTTVGRGGTHQTRVEGEVVEGTIRNRLAQLDVGDAALVFGRIDPEGTPERFYIGRVAVADEHQEPVVVDWRAPIAEPFYRATGRHPMGLARRRHFATRGRRLLAVEDEVFGAGERGDAGAGAGLAGREVLLANLAQPRSGRLGDIVGTIQAEQDEIIRSELGGVVVVQGGPGTGKTVVALHRAAYLLYTHRFPLEDQGVLVVGPNRVFLRYVERVLPSLGEAGVELAVPADLVPEAVGDRREGPAAARVKGDVRMVTVLAKAVRDRQRPLRRDLVVGFGLMSLRCDVETSRRIVAAARRRARTHNAGRRLVEQGLWEALARSAREEVEPALVRERLRRHDEIRTVLEWMWPQLTPDELLHDLFGSRALIRLAAGSTLDAGEQASLERPRGEPFDRREWTDADVPLLDEARALLGPRPGKGDEEPRSYGHLVVDEAQDLSPMALRMLSRRSLGGSMTVVGDIAQATGSWAPGGWNDVLDHLPGRRAPRVHELTIAYRTPAAVLSLAERVLPAAVPGLHSSRSVREGGDPPQVVRAAPGRLGAEVAALVGAERVAVGEGNMAVVVPDSLVDHVSAALDAAGEDHGRSGGERLDVQVSVLAVRLVKGLELDSVLVVEPARIVAEEPQGLRSLYVALTRATRRLTVVHSEPLPEVLVERRPSPA